LSIKTRLIGGASALVLAGSMMAVAAPAASADLDLVTAGNQIVSCTNTWLFASLNPTLGSSDAKYTKAAVKRNDGTVNHLSLTGQEDLGNSTSDATSCAVDTGIRTNDPGTNSASGKENPYDNQTNGQSPLTTTSGPSAALAKISGTTAGTATCNRADPGINGDYPQAYPLNGKLIYKYGQNDALAKQIQNQFYVRLGSDPADTDITHITVTGIVIKGPGVGGTVGGTLAFGASYAPTKNLNLLDCTADGTPPAAGNASLASLIIQAADGTDAGATVDPLTVTIPS
jgi:hypothetical protein